MQVVKVRDGIYRVWFRGIEGLATVVKRNIHLSPTLRGAGIGMMALRDKIAQADSIAERKADSIAERKARKLVAEYVCHQPGALG